MDYFVGTRVSLLYKPHLEGLDVPFVVTVLLPTFGLVLCHNYMF